MTTTNELPFSREEYATRLDNVRRRMDAAGIEVLLTNRFQTISGAVTTERGEVATNITVFIFP